MEDIKEPGTYPDTSMEVARELKRWEAELDLIKKVQRGISARLQMTEIYTIAGEELRRFFDAQVVGIGTFDFEKETEEFQYLFENGELLSPPPRPIPRTRKILIDTREIIHFNEKVKENWDLLTGEDTSAVPGTGEARSAVYVPLLIETNVMGYLTIQNLDRENAFSQSEVRALATLADSLSIALENARLFSEAEQRNAELAVINSVQQGLVAEMDMQGIYNLVGDCIRDLFDSQCTGISILDYDTRMEHHRYLYEDGQKIFAPPRPFHNILKLLAEKNSIVLVNENIPAFLEGLGEEYKSVEGTRHAKSMIFVPLKVGEVLKGYVTIQNLDRENAFYESDARLLSTLANSMSVALENARLYNETEQRNAELAVINSVQQGLVAEMDMQGIYELVGERIRDLFDAQTTSVCTFDHEQGTETFHYIFEDGKRHFLDPRPIDKMRQLLIQKKELIYMNEKIDEKWEALTGECPSDLPGTKVSKCALYVPMLVGDSVRGYVSLQNFERENAFSEVDIRLLSTLVNSMSIALENARLFNETTRLLEETEQHATELQTVNNISHALVSQLEFNRLIQLIGEQMRSTFNADIVYLALYDRKNNLLNFPYYYGDTSGSRPFGNGLTEKIIINKEPLLVNQDLAETYEKIEAVRRGKWVESYLGVPIIIGEEAIGVISVQSTERKNRFAESDLRLLNTVAANVGVAMQNAEAYQKLQAALTDLKAAQEQLVQQEKLASLGQLTAGIAHEIKNPLNFVNNFSDLNIELLGEVRGELQKMDPTPAIEDMLQTLSDVLENLEKIYEHGKRADGIVKSMLQHSRGGSGTLESTDLNNLIREYVNLAFHGMRAGKKAINVSIDLDLDEEVGCVSLIGEDFSRVILNLCNNAFDAMRERSNAATAPKDYLPKLRVQSRRDHDMVFIEVEDNGCGISEELKDKILQPFFTTKKGTEGTGLGLSITHDIIKSHKGSLNIVTEKDRFSRFCVSLPV